MIRLQVGGRTFTLPKDCIERHPDSLLAKCLDPNSPFRAHRTENGSYVFDRDADLFQRAILPLLCNGHLAIDEQQTDVYAVLKELDYFCLLEKPTQSPRGLSATEARVLCRVAIDRLINTLLPRATSLHVLVFAEEMDLDMVDIYFDMGLLVGALAPMLRSIALTDYQMLMQWTCFDAEVNYCNRTKSFRTASSQELVYAFNLYDQGDVVETTRWPVMAVCKIEPASQDQVSQWAFTTPNRYLYDCRETVLEVGADSCSIMINVKMCYDLLQKCTTIDLSVSKTHDWQTYISYVALFVASSKKYEPLAIDTKEATLGLVYDQIRKNSDLKIVTSPSTVRVFNRASVSSTKNERFSITENHVYIVVCGQMTCHDRLTTDDPTLGRRRLFSGHLPASDSTAAATTRIVNQTRVRRLCRLKMLGLSV